MDNFLSLFIRNPEKSYDKKKIFRKTQNLWLYVISGFKPHVEKHHLAQIIMDIVM